MNIEKYTERARGFIQSAQGIATREGHQQFTPEHILKALLDDEQGLSAGLIIGLSGGIGGLIVAALGVLGDAAGLAPVLYVLAALPLAVAALASQLPQPAAAPPGTVWSPRLEARP